MSKLKKNVFKAAIAVLIILLVFTLLSKTIYNLMLPEVKKAVMSEGPLNTSRVYSFSTVVEPGMGDDGIYSANAALTYDELHFIINQTSIPGMVFALEGEAQNIPVSLTVDDYVFEPAVQRFNTSLTVTSDAPLAEGLPLSVYMTDEGSGESYTLVPLNCLYFENGGYYIYQLVETKTLWGAGQIVKKISVEYIASDYTNAAVNISGGGGLMLASSPSKPLYDGADVKVAQ